jgi:predicted nucleic acid-binding Zn ribbon protein
MRPPPRRIPPLGPPKKTPRQRALAAWRGVDLKPEEDIRAHPARPASEILPKVLSQHLRLDQRRNEAEVLRVWQDLLDPNIVAHARPTGLVRGTLFVCVDSSVWLDELVRYRRKEILDRLQHSFGRSVIARISFRVG